MSDSEDDIVLASAARFLVDGGEEDAASVLLSCSLEFWESGDTWYVGDETHHALHVKLTGPRAASEISQSDIRIAEALDRAGILFFPNRRGRLGPGSARENREAHFLICHDGKWGILEVDGEPFHPPSRTVQDHARDRALRAHGVRLVEHFDATECYERADEVVARFLALLERT